ncbi:MAG: DUF308 domain-containing protein [Acidimicrobiia bacterium]
MLTRLKSDEITWLNPATIRGAGFVGAGLLILSTPEASERLLALVLALALLVMGATDVWGAVQVKPRPWMTIGLGVVSAAPARRSSSCPDWRSTF